MSPQLPPHGAGRAPQVGDPGRQFIESTGVILSDSRPGAAPLILGHDIPNGSSTQISKTPQRGVLTIADLELLSFVNDCGQIQTQLIRQRFSNRPFTVLLFHELIDNLDSPQQLSFASPSESRATEAKEATQRRGPRVDSIAALLASMP